MTNIARALRSNVLRGSTLALTLAALGSACASNSEPMTSGSSQNAGGGTRSGAGAPTGGSSATSQGGSGGANHVGSSNAGADNAGADNAGAGAGGTDGGPTGTAPTLPGADDSPAVGAITDLVPTASDPADIVDNIILSKLDVWLAADATVGQVNTALAAMGAQISYMQAGSDALTVIFPKVADGDALEAKRAQLASLPGVLYAAQADVAVADTLPPSPANAPASIGYMFDEKFPAAWNLSALATKNCESRKVPLWVADFFSTVPVDHFAQEVPDFTVAPNTKAGISGHGYRVTAFAAAQFDANPATGANPFRQCLDVRGIRLDNYSPLERNGIIAKAITGTKGIVNGSFGHPIPGCGKAGCTTAIVQNKNQLMNNWVLDAADWRRETAKFDDDVLFVAAGGNSRTSDLGSRYGMFRDARTSGEIAMSSSSLIFGTPRFSIFQIPGYFQPDAAYSTLPSLISPPNVVQALQVAVNLILDPTITPAQNVLIVGSTNSLSQESAFSDVGPDVHCTGENVPVVDDATDTGSSYSAPQVAGLASYLWLLSNDLREQPASVTRNAIITNAWTPVDQPNVHVIDAFASALSLDQTDSPPTPESAPIRLALLDVNDDGAFTEADIAQLEKAYATPNNNALTWGREDLNGDGVVGGASRVPFDLDRDGSVQYGKSQLTTVIQRYAGNFMSFDETGVTDHLIVCYYAFSPLYTGDVNARDNLIGAQCGLPPPPDGGAGGSGSGGGNGGSGGGSATGCFPEQTYFCTANSQCCPGLICGYTTIYAGGDYPVCYHP